MNTLDIMNNFKKLQQDTPNLIDMNTLFLAALQTPALKDYVDPPGSLRLSLVTYAGLLRFMAEYFEPTTPENKQLAHQVYTFLKDKAAPIDKKYQL